MKTTPIKVLLRGLLGPPRNADLSPFEFRVHVKRPPTVPKLPQETSQHYYNPVVATTKSYVLSRKDRMSLRVYWNSETLNPKP